MNGTAITSEPIAWLFMIKSMTAKMLSAGETFAATGILASMVLHNDTKTLEQKLSSRDFGKLRNKNAGAGVNPDVTDKDAGEHGLMIGVYSQGSIV